MRQMISIAPGIGSPVQRAAGQLSSDGFATARQIRVPPDFDDVDLSGLWPAAVSGARGKHPNGRPDPVAFGHLGADYDGAEGEVERVFRHHPGGLYRVDDVPSSGSIANLVCYLQFVQDSLQSKKSFTFCIRCPGPDCIPLGSDPACRCKGRTRRNDPP